MKNLIDPLIYYPGTEAFGLTLLHSLWQGLLVAVILFVALRFVKKSSQLRYLLGCGALAAVLLAFGYTFYLNYTALAPQTGINAGLSPSSYSLDIATLSQFSAASPDSGFSFETFYALVSAWIGKYAHFIFFLWLAGFLGFATRLGFGLYFAKKLKNAGEMPAKQWLQKLDDFKQRLGIHHNVHLLVSKEVETPLTIGWLRPVILLPIGMLTQLPYEHLESILLHELAHIKRQDYLVNLLQSAAETLLFFNPAYWYIAGIIEQERENACDDMAVQIIQKPAVYARALSNVALLSQTDNILSATTLGANQGKLSDRIKRILRSTAEFQNLQKSERAKWYIFPVLAIIFLVGITIAADVKGNEPQTSQLEQNVKPQEIDTTVNVSLDMEENINLDIDKDLDLDIHLDLDIEAQESSMQLDSSSLYNFLQSQWETIKKSKEAMGEEVPENDLLSEKTLYIVDGIARDPRDIRPPFDYTTSIPHTIMWAAMQFFDFTDIEDSYAAFRKKFPGNYKTVVILTSRMSKDEPFTVRGRVFDSETKTPLAGTKVLLKGESTGTVTDAGGNYSLRVPDADAWLSFTPQGKGYRTIHRPVKWNWKSNMDVYARHYSFNSLKKIPEVDINNSYGNSQKKQLSNQEALISSDTGTIKGKASGIVLSIDKNAKGHPLFFVDGSEVSQEDLNKLDPESLREVEVLKGEKAIDRYGERGKNGVVLITTKAQIEAKKEAIVPEEGPEQSLYIIDGKRSSYDKFSKLSPHNIQSVSVIKGKQTEEMYGEEGRNGVIIVVTKQTQNEVNDKLTGQLKIREKENEEESSSVIQLRGPSGERALFLLDGEKTEYSALQPDELQSITVIKGADAAKYITQFPGDYDAVILATSKSKSGTEKRGGVKEDNLSIFPNPSDNIFTIRLDIMAESRVQATVMDEVGQIVEEIADKILVQGQHELQWDAGTQKPGLYRIRIIQNGETTYRNVIVK